MSDPERCSFPLCYHRRTRYCAECGRFYCRFHQPPGDDICVRCQSRYDSRAIDGVWSDV